MDSDSEEEQVLLAAAGEVELEETQRGWREMEETHKGKSKIVREVENLEERVAGLREILQRRRRVLTQMEESEMKISVTKENMRRLWRLVQVTWFRCVTEGQ